MATGTDGTNCWVDMHAIGRDDAGDAQQNIVFFAGSMGDNATLHRSMVRINNNIAENFINGPSQHRVHVRVGPAFHVYTDALDWLSAQNFVPGVWSMLIRRPLPISNDIDIIIFSFSDKKFATIFKVMFG